MNDINMYLEQLANSLKYQYLTQENHENFDKSEKK